MMITVGILPSFEARDYIGPVFQENDLGILPMLGQGHLHGPVKGVGSLGKHFFQRLIIEMLAHTIKSDLFRQRENSQALEAPML
jgi:hypothetical protein